MHNIFIFALIPTFFVVVYGQYGSMIGPGLWNILSIKKYQAKEGDDIYMNVDAKKRRLNRTHEGYNVTCHLKKDFEESYGITLEICKEVDGGCKPFQLLTDESIIHFMEKYSKENVKNFLISAGIDPPEFPVAAGTYRVENYMIDYCNLPPNCPYGDYEATACVMKGTQKVGCVAAIAEFIQDDNNVCS